jgi:hypothetical protein
VWFFKLTYIHSIANSKYPTTPPQLATPTWSHSDIDVIVKAMKVTNKTPTVASRVAAWLQPFWAKGPTIWFRLAEAQFSLAGITEEKTKFYCILSKLDHSYAVEVQDIVTSAPLRDLYTKLKTELRNRQSPSRGRRARNLTRPT